jgi:E3 ubiquitin-protein ligase UBR1
VIQRALLTLISDPEWHRFLLPPGGTQLLPDVNDPTGFVWTDEYGVLRTWSLHALQQSADAELVARGKQPVRKQRPGRSCGRVLQRQERTYTCK